MEEDYIIDPKMLTSLTEAVEAMKQHSDSELFKTIGYAIDREGYDIHSSIPSEKSISQTSNHAFDTNFLHAKYLDSTHNKIDLDAFLSFSLAPEYLDAPTAEEHGERLWEIVKKQMKLEICNNEIIVKELSEDGNLHKAMVFIIPAILSTLGLTIINPIITLLIASFIALILRIGIKSFCEFTA